jgi:hypothetical protein
MNLDFTIPHEFKNSKSIVGMGLIIISLLAAISIASTVGKKSPYIVPIHSIASGTKIKYSDVKSISLVDAGLSTSYVHQGDQVIGKYSTSQLNAGELISQRSLSLNSANAHINELPLQILKGNYPHSLSVGDFVDIYSLSNMTQNGGKLPSASLTIKHQQILEIDTGTSNYSNSIVITVRDSADAVLTQLAQINGSTIVVVKSNA